jgi:hypothetical protein
MFNLGLGLRKLLLRYIIMNKGCGNSGSNGACEAKMFLVHPVMFVDKGDF